MSDEDWTRTIFSDEKKFNLDGPDGFQDYWHDLRKEKQIFSTRHFCGSSVMVWGAFGGAMTSMLAKYVSTLEHCLVPFLDELSGDGLTFQQDDASIHHSRYTVRRRDLWTKLFLLSTGQRFRRT